MKLHFWKALLFFIITMGCFYILNQESNPKALKNKFATDIIIDFEALKKENQENLSKALQINSKPNFYKLGQSLIKKEHILLILENDSLVYWNNAFINITNIGTIHDTLFNNNNNWYYGNTAQKNHTKIILLSKVGSSYPIENQYFKHNLSTNFKYQDKVEFSSVYNSKFPYKFTTKSKSALFFGIRDISSTFSYQYFYITSFIVFFLLFTFTFSKILLENKKPLLFFAFSSIIIYLRLLMSKYLMPLSLYGTQLFSPELYSENIYIGSIGDLLLNLLVLNILLFTLKKYLFNIKLRTSVSFLIQCISTPVLLIYFNTVIKSLVINSTLSFNFYNWQNLNTSSLLGVLALVLLVFSVLQFNYRINSIFISNRLTLKQKIGSIIIGLLFYIIYAYIQQESFWYWIAMGIVFSTSLVIVSVKNNFATSLVLKTLGIVLLGSLLNIKLIKNSISKSIEQKHALAKKMHSQFNIKADILFPDLESSIQKSFENNQDNLPSNTTISKTLQTNLVGFWDRFDYSWIADYKDSTIAHNLPNALNIKQIQSLDIGKNKLTTIQLNGVSYLTFTTILNNKDKDIALYVILKDKAKPRDVYYPDIFIDNKNTDLKLLNQYSYAKYNNNKLTIHGGDFEYPNTTQAWMLNNNITDTTFNRDDFEHVLVTDEDCTILISNPTLKPYNLIFGCIYWGAFLTLIFFITNCNKKNINLLKIYLDSSFKNRILYYSFLSLILFFIVSLLVITFNTINQNNYQTKKTLEHSIKKCIHHIGLAKETDFETINLLANLTGVDVNYYNLSGNIQYYSNHDALNKGVYGNKIPFDVMNKIMHEGSNLVFKTDNISSIAFPSVYAPVFNNLNKIEGIIGIPFIVNKKELTDDIYQNISSITNVFIVVLLLMSIVYYFISRNLTKSLEHLNKELANLSLKTNLTKVNWKSNDEIGLLVNKYNTVLEELELSTKKIIDSEKDSAWKEMARQIAHEIKNPLTPMKLNLQYLQKLVDSNDLDAIQTKGKNISNVLLEQIDILTQVSNSFSDFSKLNVAHLKQVDIIDILNHSINLFANSKAYNINFEYTEQPIWLQLDREQIIRAFTNLISNAIQACNNKENAIITCSVITNTEMCIIKISDNGKGIKAENQAKIFTPYFTTKSSGTGLGLAMVKNCVIANNGTISFETTENIGTTFTLMFPLV